MGGGATRPPGASGKVLARPRRAGAASPLPARPTSSLRRPACPASRTSRPTWTCAATCGRASAAGPASAGSRTFPLAPGGLVAPPPPHHALANDFARYVRPLPLGGGDGRTRASRVDRDDRLLRPM